MSSFDFAVAEDGRTVVVTGEGCCPPVTAFPLPDGLTLDDDAILSIAHAGVGTLLVRGADWQVELVLPSEVRDWLVQETIRDAWQRGAGDE